jgi:hypothetical protein
VLAVRVKSDVSEVARRLDAGDSVNGIAADLGVTARTIRNRLHAAGLPLASTRSRQRRHSLLADPSWLRRQHVDEGLSAWAIGKEWRVSLIAHRRVACSLGERCNAATTSSGWWRDSAQVLGTSGRCHVGCAVNGVCPASNKGDST